MSRGAAPSLWPPLLILGSIYAAVALAELLAPHPPFEQYRAWPLAPPTRPHFFDAEGRFHVRPFIYGLVDDPERPGAFIRDRKSRHPLRFWVPAEPRRLGPFTVRHRLVGLESGSDGEHAGDADGVRLFLFGTDRFGRDLFSRLLYGGRLSLGAGLLAGCLSVGLGLLLGAAAGYHGGVVDELLMRGAELVLALPWLYLLIGVRAFLPLDTPPEEAFLMTVVVIALLGWVRPGRLVRGVVRAARQRDFVLAARGFGASELYILWRHVLPRTRSVALTQLAILVPRYVLAEVTLSFLGLGIAEPAPSWGNMLAELTEIHLLTAHWWMSLPALALIGVILSYHRLTNVLDRRFAAGAF